jgi:hypothetical protein
MGKRAVLLLIAVLAASNLLMVGSVFAQSTPTPSVPEFTLKLEAHPYDLPPVYETNPYTGDTVMTEESYRVENKSIVVSIKNQPFPTSFNGVNCYLYYYVRVKGHFEESWSVLMRLYASDTEYTTKTYILEDDHELNYKLEGIDSGGEVDFQVKAKAGYDSQVWITDHPTLVGPLSGHYEAGIAMGEESDWSNTQTIKVPANEPLSSTTTPTPSQTPTATQTPTPSPTPNQEPQQTEQIETIIGAAILVAVLGSGLSLLLYLIKRK